MGSGCARWALDAVMESQNCFGLERPLRSSSPAANSAQPSPPGNPVPKCHIQVPPGVVTPPLPWAAVPVLENSFHEENSPDIQPKPSLAQLESISSFPVTSDWEEDLAATSSQVVVESHKVCPECSFCLKTLILLI